MCSRTIFAALEKPCGGGKSEIVEGCTNGKCAEWTNWGEWSACTQTCGGGMTKRSRQCVVPKSRSGKSITDIPKEELPCTGPSTSMLFCNLEDCPPSVYEWTPWTVWTECSKKCGNDGQRQRSRECKIVESVWKSQGLVARPKDVKCPGRDADAGKCNNRPCEQWTTWGPWSSCSVDCGDGKQFRNRNCENINYGNDSSKVYISIARAIAKHKRETAKFF